MHFGFTAAYGLTLGFMVIATLMLIIGKRWYGTAASYTRTLDRRTYVS